MDARLDGKVALVTGAGQGIGREIARCFHRRGARVWATSRRLGPLEDLRQPGLEILELDVTRPDQVAAAAGTAGAVDVLVNCAGYVAEGSILDCAPEDLERSLEVNVRGAYRVIRAFLPAMLAGGGGAVINIASVLSSISSAPARFAYGTSKGALMGLTKSVARDYAHRGIRCNAVCPGAVETPGLNHRMAAMPDPQAARSAMTARHPAGRLGTPAEVAAACLYLASDAGAFMTGQQIVIDGGMTI